jgi:hypothetical protein
VQAARDKLKAALPQDVKVHEDEVKVRRDKKARIKLATPVPLKKVKFEEIKKKPPARDSVCIGDLLNHYGASQQIACQSPCKYIHYTDIPHGMAKQSILQRFQARLALTDATVAFVTSKIKADTKFKSDAMVLDFIAASPVKICNPAQKAEEERIH